MLHLYCIMHSRRTIKEPRIRGKTHIHSTMTRHFVLLILLAILGLRDSDCAALYDAPENGVLTHNEYLEARKAFEKLRNNELLSELDETIISEIINKPSLHRSELKAPDKNSKFLNDWYESLVGLMSTEIPHDPVAEDVTHSNVPFPTLPSGTGIV